MKNFNFQKGLFPLLLVIALLFSCENIYSQTTEIKVIDSTAQKPNKFKFGLGFGLSFVGGTNVSLAPNVIYNASEKFSFGMGVQGSYTAIKDVQNTTTIGGNVIALYTPVKILTTLVEFTELNVSTKVDTPEGSEKDNFWDSALFLGAGININEKISVGAKYNVLYNEDESVYTSPVIPFVNISF
ncbi:MAG: hypothetical protein HKN48_10785 [Flavobacteriaceae bacterium]|nr:hypothetical protein [Flavobacteriaceae bacterium]